MAITLDALPVRVRLFPRRLSGHGDIDGGNCVGGQLKFTASNGLHTRRWGPVKNLGVRRSFGKENNGAITIECQPRISHYPNNRVSVFRKGKSRVSEGRAISRQVAASSQNMHRHSQTSALTVRERTSGHRREPTHAGDYKKPTGSVPFSITCEISRVFFAVYLIERFPHNYFCASSPPCRYVITITIAFIPGHIPKRHFP